MIWVQTETRADGNGPFLAKIPSNAVEKGQSNNWFWKSRISINKGLNFKLYFGTYKFSSMCITVLIIKHHNAYR